MPIYEYECSSCHDVIEVNQRINEEPLTSCPDCSGTLRKLISMSAFHLKGKGWYADGYSSNPSTNGKHSGIKDKNGKSTPNSKSQNGKTAVEKNSANIKESNTTGSGCKATACE